VRVTRQDEDTRRPSFVGYDDKTLSLTDCVSFVLMRRLKRYTAICLDRDLARRGFARVPYVHTTVNKSWARRPTTRYDQPADDRSAHRVAWKEPA